MQPAEAPVPYGTRQFEIRRGDSASADQGQATFETIQAAPIYKTHISLPAKAGENRGFSRKVEVIRFQLLEIQFEGSQIAEVQTEQNSDFKPVSGGDQMLSNSGIRRVERRRDRKFQQGQLRPASDACFPTAPRPHAYLKRVDQRLALLQVGRLGGERRLQFVEDLGGVRHRDDDPQQWRRPKKFPL